MMAKRARARETRYNGPKIDFKGGIVYCACVRKGSRTSDLNGISERLT